MPLVQLVASAKLKLFAWLPLIRGSLSLPYLCLSSYLADIVGRYEGTSCHAQRKQSLFKRGSGVKLCLDSYEVPEGRLRTATDGSGAARMYVALRCQGASQPKASH